MHTSKTRHQFYLPDDLSERLEVLARKAGASKTQILTEALRAWIERGAANELDERFAPRLDRQQRSLQRLETTLNIAAEVLDLFVQHQLTLVAHQPAFDIETGQLGVKRYRQFMDQVGRRLSARSGRTRMIEIVEQKERS